MNEKDKLAFEGWVDSTSIYDVDPWEAWQAALEYARGQQEPVAFVNDKCAIQATLHGAITLKPGDDLYTAPPAAAINEQLLEALKELMYARTDKAEGMAEAAIVAAEAEKAKGGV